jgi:hypothetical protein
MSFNPSFLALACGALVCACASQPTPTPQVGSLDCDALGREVRAAEDAQRAAAQQQQDAWKAVVPFAVMARYGKGKAAADESQQRLDALHQEAALRGCAIAGQ